MEIQKKLLHKYFRGETIPSEEKQIMDWAGASSENYDRYLEERKKWNALLIHYNTVPGRTKPARRPQHTFLFRKITGIAASVALIMALFWLAGSGDTWKKEATLQTVIVPVGQRVQLLLADGTKVWLNSKTTFSYPASFGKQTREVVLDGEAYFEVVRKERKPFIVKTQKYNIKVLGTSFNVYAYKKGRLFETSLLKGSVDISAVNKKNHHIILRPNEKAYEVDGLLKKDTIGNPNRFRWKDGLICLDDIPFEKLMEKFEVYYDIKIKVENKTALDYRCTGKFRQSDGIEYALRVLQRDIKFGYTRNDETNTITIQ